MPVADTACAIDRLAALRIELVEQAYALERQGRLDAADVALATSLRIAEVGAELEAGEARAGIGPAACPRVFPPA